MKKGIIISIIAVIVLTVIACIALSNTYFSPYEKQIRLAYKYLDEGNYEEAILGFDKAIQIDAKKPKAYIGKADVYITRCDENAIVDATAALKLGYEQAEANKTAIVEAVTRLADFLKETGLDELAYEFSKVMYEIMPDEKISDWLVDYIKDYVENTDEPNNEFFSSAFKEIYDITKSDKLVDWLKNYAEKNLDNLENKYATDILDLLNYVYEINQNKNINKLINTIQKTVIKNALKQVYEKYAAGDELAVKDFAVTDMLKLSLKGLDDECVFYSETGNLNDKGSKGIALFKNKRLYLGEWENGKLNGNGRCYRSIKIVDRDEIVLNYIEGYFTDGIPNGHCLESQDIITGGSRHSEVYEGLYVMAVREGDFKRKSVTYSSTGKTTSNFSFKDLANIEKEVLYYDHTYIDGVVQINEKFKRSIGGNIYASRGINDDRYAIVYTGRVEKAFNEEWQ